MKHTLFVATLSFLAFSACKKKNISSQSSADQYTTQKTQVMETYANLAFAGYDDALSGAIDLQTAIHAFTTNPTQQSFDNAKTKWLESRESYIQTEIFRFADGPIDNITDGPEGLINSWPLDEMYIDYVQGVANAGIINNPASYPTITEELIVTKNELGGEENISAGYHAIEFLLWGQDFYANSPGQRPYTDYVTGSGGTASNQDRRATYLNLASDLLVLALQQVRNAWDPAGTNNYRTTFLGLSTSDALHKMFNSLRVLSGTELAGERMTVAYNNENQEDEQSCFSDNTHRDIILDAQAIMNLYTGSYTRTDGTVVSGYSISDLVAEINAAHNTAMLTQLNASKDAIAQISVPFDQAIIYDRPDVLNAINALLEEADSFHTIGTTDLKIVF